MSHDNTGTADGSNIGLSGSRFYILLLTTLTILSGCCALAYEVLYVRVLTSLLGDMFYIHAALLSTFLIGIGLGSKLAHKYLRQLWIFEILTGLYAVAMPFLSSWFSQQSVMVSITSSPALTIVATTLFIAAPSLLIGFSIPLFSAYLKAQDVQRLAFQGIYKAYNFGAFLSILVVELVMIRLLGIKTSLAIIGAINIFNGLVLLFMKFTPKPIALTHRVFPKRLICALCIGSLSSAIFQMFFLKLSYLVFYPHRENFAIGLSVTMLGIFLGAWLASKIRIRFETSLILAAAMIALIYAGYLPILRLFEATVSWAQQSELLIIAHKYAFGCVFALGPMIMFGTLIPALMRSEEDVAEESGHLLWVSSLSNAFGYLVYVLIGHQLFAANVLLSIIIIALIAAGLLAVSFRFSKTQVGFILAALLLVVVMNIQWQEKYFYLAHWVDKLEDDQKVTIFKSGAESASLVQSDESQWISYNGHPGLYFWDRGFLNTPEMLSGIIPALNAPSHDRAMVIGFGTGITAGASAKIFKTTDVVEINDAFYKMMPELSNINFNIENNPAAELHLADGRAFLVGKEQMYDAIVNSVSAPTYFSASKIYTVEFYKSVAKALKPGGVFCLWLRSAEMSEEGIITILSALKNSFRYCELRVLKESYYMATCYNQPVKTRLFSELPVHQDVIDQMDKNLAGFNLDEFFEDIHISDNLFRDFDVKLEHENTDDHPVLEFQVMRAYQLKKGLLDPFITQQDSFNIDPVRKHEDMDMKRLTRRAGTLWVLGSGLFKTNFVPLMQNDLDATIDFMLWSADYLIVRDKPQEAIKTLRSILQIKSDNAQVHYKLGNLFETNGQIQNAISHYQQAIKSQTDFPKASDRLEKLLKSQDRSD